MSRSCDLCRADLMLLIESKAPEGPDTATQPQPATALSQAARKRCLQHLAICADCRAEHRRLCSIVASLQTLPPTAAPPDLRARVRAALDAQPYGAGRLSARGPLAWPSRLFDNLARPYRLAWVGGLAVSVIACVALRDSGLDNLRSVSPAPEMSRLSTTKNIAPPLNKASGGAQLRRPTTSAQKPNSLHSHHQTQRAAAAPTSPIPIVSSASRMATAAPFGGLSVGTTGGAGNSATINGRVWAGGDSGAKSPQPTAVQRSVVGRARPGASNAKRPPAKIMGANANMANDKVAKIAAVPNLHTRTDAIAGGTYPVVVAPSADAAANSIESVPSKARVAAAAAAAGAATATMQAQAETPANTEAAASKPLAEPSPGAAAAPQMAFGASSAAGNSAGAINDGRTQAGRPAGRSQFFAPRAGSLAATAGNGRESHPDKADGPFGEAAGVSPRVVVGNVIELKLSLVPRHTAAAATLEVELADGLALAKPSGAPQALWSGAAQEAHPLAIVTTVVGRSSGRWAATFKLVDKAGTVIAVRTIFVEVVEPPH